jgi:hypothetical protein
VTFVLATVVGVLAVVAVALLAQKVMAGRSVSRETARRLVEEFNNVVSEAYRRCDIRLIDSVVGLNTVEGSRLTGLIGVRMDMGISLDAQLLELEIERVETEPDLLRVTTKERWHYRDLGIGTGERVGEESTDRYEMLYLFTKEKDKWMVSETRFVTEPMVGRKTTPWEAPQQMLHPAAPAPAASGEKQP